MGLVKRKPDFSHGTAHGASILPLQPLPSLLTAGGDQRLALTAGANAYGCRPYPEPRLFDFASSTASTISAAAYARVETARNELLFAAIHDGSDAAFDAAVEQARRALRKHLGLGDAEVLFAPSGTDAQLHALSLAKASFGGAPLTTIIVGADQTGSGTAYTALGRHFGACTARGEIVEKNGAIDGLAGDVVTVAVPFCEGWRLHAGAVINDAVLQAVETAVAAGRKVLLQIMDASKLGWRAPGDACLREIESRWPDDVRVVVDACQLRTSRLKAYLDRGWPVLITGSKFFTGPAFSGALLVPKSLAECLADKMTAPEGLRGYATSFDIPKSWPMLRAAYPHTPNFGQWLRWEAALEEMRAYFAVPAAFREAVLAEFAARIPTLIAATRNLCLLTERAGEEASGEDGEMRHATIFSFVPQCGGAPLSSAQCARLHKALRFDLSSHAAEREALVAAQPCQVGQPVALKHRAGSALRICVSARLVSRCFELNETAPRDAVGVVLAEAAELIAKLDWLCGRPDILESFP